MTRIRLAAYRVLAWLYSLHEARHGRRWGGLDATFPRGLPPAAGGEGSIIFYAATIGELQAVRPLIASVRTAKPNLSVVLLAGQTQYVDSFQELVPDAAVGTLPGPTLGAMEALFERVRPRLVVVSEGPSLHSRFPIRMGLGLPATCLNHQVPMIVTNACLYELSLGSRIDAVEYRLFGDLHRNAIQRWYVPFDRQREELIEAGVAPEAISIAGDLKFDNLPAIREREPETDLRPLLERLQSRPTVVGASLNHGPEEEALLAGWRQFQTRYPEACLVLAPRYVNRPEVMERICNMLARESIRYARRSDGVDAAMENDVLLLDVFGELTHYFAVADTCFMGRDHGVLEPLAFGKPMVTANRDTWQDFNTSYPLYRLMVEGEALVELEDLDQMGDTLIRLREDAQLRAGYVDRAAAIVASQQGAIERLRTDILTCLTPACGETP